MGFLKLIAIAGFVVIASAGGCSGPADDVGSVDVAAEATSSDIVLLVVFLAIALGFSFICSVAEAVLLSITPSYAAQMREAEHPASKLIDSLKENVERPLSAILSLNTIAHTVGATGVGAQALKVFGQEWMAAVSAVLTLLILVLSEIIPKTIGAVYWRTLAPMVARLTKWLILLMYPLVVMSEQLGKMFAPAHAHPTVTRAEVAALAMQGANDGHIDAGESRIVSNLFRFRELTVQDIMTPRTVVLSLPETTTVGEAMEKHPTLQFSRVPVFENTRDEVTGFVLKDDLLLAHARGENDKALSELRRKILAVPEASKLSQLFEQLINSREHLALVLDEFGGTAGLVTLEDLVETLFGLEIVDEADRNVDMQKLARDKWRERAKKLGIEVDAVQRDLTPDEKDNEGKTE